MMVDGLPDREGSPPSHPALFCCRLDITLLDINPLDINPLEQFVRESFDLDSGCCSIETSTFVH